MKDWEIRILKVFSERTGCTFKYFEKLVNLYPFGYDALLMFAWTNFQMGKAREAKVLFGKVLLISPEDASAKEGLSLLE